MGTHRTLRRWALLGLCRSVVCDRQPGGWRIWLAGGESAQVGARPTLSTSLSRRLSFSVCCVVFRPSASPGLLPMIENRSNGQGSCRPDSSFLGFLRRAGRDRPAPARRFVRAPRGGARINSSGYSPSTRADAALPHPPPARPRARVPQPSLPQRGLSSSRPSLADTPSWTALMRGEPVPRGGERKQPNPVFLAHAAALTELYVAVVTNARAAGFKRLGYQREGEAREAFKDGMRERALAPTRRSCSSTSMTASSARLWRSISARCPTRELRGKAELYAAYAASDAWRSRHKFVPALLFLTTTDIRTSKFLKALARALSYGPPSISAVRSSPVPPGSCGHRTASSPNHASQTWTGTPARRSWTS